MMMRNLLRQRARLTTRTVAGKRHRRAAITLALVLTCAAIALVVSATHAVSGERRSPEPPKISEPAAPPATQGGSREAPRFVRFNLFDQGIYPREIHVAQGLLAIAIEDYSGGTTGLVVERENGNAPQQVGVVGRGDPPWRGKGEMRLAPGRYQVYMADRPDNRALLVVEP